MLRIHDVDASYGGVIKVLENVTVQVPRGRTVAVVGESGSGKSTLARAITGLLPPLQGEIYFDGKPLPRALKDRDKDTLRRIQMIYQSPDTALNPRQTVRDIIGRPLEFYLGLKGQARDRKVVELLELIELNEDLHRPPAGRIVGRPEAARLHCPRARRRARAHHLRRGHLGARPDRPGGHPEAAAPAAEGDQRLLSLHHP